MYIYIEREGYILICPIGVQQGHYIALAIAPCLGRIAIDPFMGRGARARARPMC